ncbi:hypothetical protein ABZZ36_40855 [Actinacidiphila glaucinigra]|uniref:hypothetical protein n=1 Tax=Actinacidiphila glaucinigra TaxID=235986 RepID=UPI0033A88F8E
MTDTQGETSHRGARAYDAVLRLYPAAYRRRHGAEIAATFEDVIDGAGRAGALREAAAVVGHALRMRTGLGSSRPAGRLLAGLLPYIFAVAASASAALLAVWPLTALPWDGERTYTPVAYMPWLVVLGCALAGRWPWARIAAAVAAISAAVSVPVAYWTGGALGLSQNLPTLVGLALAAAAVLAAPPDLPPVDHRSRRAAALTALALGVPMVVGSVTVFEVPAGGAGLTASARPDPMFLFAMFAPLVLAFPAAVGLARFRYGAFLAVALGATSFSLLWFPYPFAFPYAMDGHMAWTGTMTAAAALMIRLGLRLRLAWQRRQTS